MSASRSHRVVIIGGGFAGSNCARALDRRGGGVETVVVDRNDYSIFYPLLIEAGTGSLEPRHVVIPVRSFLGAGRFEMKEVTGVDLESREVHCRSEITGEETSLGYDHLVLAPGSVTNLPDLPGLHEHGFQMKSLADAVALRDRAVAMLEAASLERDPELRRELLHFVVVGANFTGVEVAGEFDMFLKRAARGYEGVRPEECQVTLVEIDDRILGTLDEGLAGYARAHLERRGVRVILEDSVTGLDERSARLKSSSSLRARTVIWCAGIAPSPLVKLTGLPVDERGYILCDPDCRVQGHDDVWAVGDAAVNTDEKGETHPATAQHAVRQGRHVAANIARVLAGRPTLPLESGSSGTLAGLGCRSGVAEVFGIRLSGFPAWWLYRTVYLMKMPGLGRKARVALDWTLDLVFPKDVVQLGLHRAAPRRPRGSEERSRDSALASSE